MTTTTIMVGGMTCEHCVRAVRTELLLLDGVSAVDVDLTSGAVSIASAAALDDAALRDAVEEAGYALAP